MDRTLAERHYLLADNARRGRKTSVEVEERGADRAWNDPQFTAHEFLDFNCAISGDDLARLNAFEPKREPRIWRDILRSAA